MKRYAYIAAGVLLAALTLTTTGCRNFSMISPSEEIQIGKDVAAEYEKKYKVITDTDEARLIERIGNRLVAGMKKAEGKKAPDYPFTFKLLKSKDVNAFALPGGPVYVFEGLMAEAKGNEDMLAGVLAHEMGHVVARHGVKQMSSQMAVGTLIAAFTKGSTQDIAMIASELVMLKYSRDDEYEADAKSIRYTHAAGYNPEGLIEFFDKLLNMKDNKESADLVSANLRTHPLTRNRIIRARQEIKTVTGSASSVEVDINKAPK